MWVLGQEKMELLEKSSAVAPLLARLNEWNESYQLAKDDDTMERVELAKVMVDMLSLELKPRESELVTDVLLELIRQAEVDLRQALSARLAHIEGIPLRMILHLANDEIRVADPILRHSPVLQDMDLVYIIKSQQTSHWQAIAARKSLSGQVINVLADTGDVDTAVTLAENKTITLTDYALNLFVPLAGQSDKLAQPLLTRPDLPQEMVSRLYQVVGEELKKNIRTNFDQGASIAVDLVDEIVSEAVQVTEESFIPSARTIHLAEEMKAKGALSTATMLGSLKRGLIPSFIAQFATYGDLSIQVAHDMLSQKSGQSLAVACRALGIRKSDFISFYLMSHRMRRRQQPIIDNHDLSLAVKTYDSIHQPDAVRLLRQSQTSH